MKCPGCVKEMAEKSFGNVKVDVCDSGCKSMWFDQYELDKLDQPNEGVSSALDQALHSPRQFEQSREKRKCPRCAIPMHVHKYKSSKDVNVDECYQCGGFFLDAGELAVIRNTFMDDKAKTRYLEQLARDLPSLKTKRK